MKVLILDDDQDLLEALRRILVQYGYEVDCADNVPKALGMVKESNYDFVLVDYKMPGDDGVCFMKNADLPPGTKVILITAYVNRDVINRMFDLGASGYLIKPFDEADLLRHLSYHTPSHS